MSYFVHSSGMAYSDYLKSKSFFDDLSLDNQKISFDLSGHTRTIIASKEILEENGLDLQSSPHGNTELDRISYDASTMVSETGDFTAKIQCAYANLMVPDDNANYYADELNRNRLQPPSLKLYERARKLFQDGLYSDSCNECLNIIELTKNSSTLKPDWRLYQLLGVLYLGFVDCDYSLINLAKAEQAFAASAQCARDDNPFECAKALMLTGWAAYCQGKMGEALKYSEHAVMTSRALSEAKYLVAKILMATNNVEKAHIYLGKAIESDPFYAIKAAGDGDFKKHNVSLDDIFESIVDRYASYLEKLKDVFENSITDPDIKAEIQAKVEEAISDKSLLKYVTRYKDLSTSIWIITENEYLLCETRNVVVKQEFWYSNKVIEQVKDEYGIRTLNFNMIGNKHSIELSFSCNYVEFKPGNFFISRTQVTQGLWNEVMGYKAFAVSGSNYPVYEVNWYDCIEFCNKLSLLLNYKPCYHIEGDTYPPNWTKGNIEFDPEANGFRLPTEAEWEFAAKGGDYTHKYPYSGSIEANDVAWFDKNSKSKLSPVAQKMPNELGLFDMSGNVWEWCWDNWYETDRRILRGGAYFSSAALCAVSGRGHGSAANAGIANGLRLVINPKTNLTK